VRRDQFITYLMVGRDEYRLYLVQGHFEVPKTADNLGGRDLVGGVPAVASLRVDFSWLEQTAVVVMTQRLDTQMRSAGKITDREQV